MSTPMKEPISRSNDRETALAAVPKAKGLTFRRHFTKAGRHPYDDLVWEMRSAVIGPSGVS